MHMQTSTFVNSSSPNKGDRWKRGKKKKSKTILASPTNVAYSTSAGQICSVKAQILQISYTLHFTHTAKTSFGAISSCYANRLKKIKREKNFFLTPSQREREKQRDRERAGVGAAYQRR